MKVFFIILYTLGIVWNSMAQHVIYMRDADTKLPLPFATAECTEKSWGIYSDSSGKVVIPNQIWQLGTVTFSFVGHASVSQGEVLKKDTIYLQKLPNKLDEVVIKNCKEKEKKKLQIRRKNDHHSLGYSAKSVGYMWATYVPNIYNKRGTINTISFGAVSFHKAALASAPVRLRFYEWDSVLQMPEEEITNEVIDVVPGKFKWVTIDLSKYHLPISATGIVVAFEMFDAGPQYHYMVMHNMSDGTKQEWEHYGWLLEGIKNVSGFHKITGGKWDPQTTIVDKDKKRLGPAVGLSIEVCVE